MANGKKPIDQEWPLSALFLKKGRVLVEGVSGCEDRGVKRYQTCRPRMAISPLSFMLPG